MNLIMTPVWFNKVRDMDQKLTLFELEVASTVLLSDTSVFGTT